jgi:RND family efflux transporter MFP subunit
MTGIRRRRLGTAATGLAVVALWACGRPAADAKEGDAPNAVVTIGTENIAVVTRDSLASGPAVSGTLAPEREATLRAQLSGAVTGVRADQGSRVSTGTLLATLDDRTQRDLMLSARSAQVTAQQAAEKAKRDLERSERLAAAGAIPERDLEQARWNNTAAQSQLAEAQSRLTLAQKQLNDAQVRAPFAGVVSARAVSEGDVVQPGTALFTVVDPSSMRYEAAVQASQLAMVRIGAPVSFTVSGYPGRRFLGRVARMNPTADPTTGQVRIVVSVPNAGGSLVGGLFAEGRIAAERRLAITAPFSAVDQRSLRPQVLRLKAGKAERVEVSLGVRDEERERIEIVQGVSAGDTLLVGAAQGITPGTSVRVGVPSDRPSAKD